MSAGLMGFPRLDYYEVESTLDIAREQARRGGLHGTLITAVHQTAGRGRRGAAWHDSGGKPSLPTPSPNAHDDIAPLEPAGNANALVTYILRPSADELPLRDAWRLPFIASLACVEALRGIGFAEAQVKWPNDLVLSGKKVGGLLVESVVVEESADRVYLLGIGINVGQTVFPRGTQYALEPTSLRLERSGSDAAPNAVDVIEAVTTYLEQAWLQYLPKREALIDAWRAYQMTGQRQAGLDSATGVPLSGRYVDVRSGDGAALISVGVDDSLVAMIASH